MQEVDAVLTCKKNNLHEYVKQRQEQAAAQKTGNTKGAAP
jgi:hypothetical protein